MPKRPCFALFIGVLWLSCLTAAAQTPPERPKNVQFKSNIAYSPNSPANTAQLLDYYLPAKTKNFPLIIWFHGGGLTAGTKNSPLDQGLALRFVQQGIGIAMVDYRLSPNAPFPYYVQDAAMATAFVLKNSQKLKANPNAIFVAGYSAGAYLTALLALDSSHLNAVGVTPQQLAGYIAISGQMSTHFTVRKERGQSNAPFLVDEAAPLFHTKANTPPLLLLTGDQDWPARLEENQMLYAQLKQVNASSHTYFQVIPNRTHASLFEDLLQEEDPAGVAIKTFINRYTPAANSPAKLNH